MLCSRRCWVSPLPDGNLVRTVVRYFSTPTTSASEPLWKDPFKSAVKKDERKTGFKEVDVNWDYVDRLLPLQVIPEVPKHEKYPTPSGWFPPRGNSNLPYYVSRRPDHLFPLYTSLRRDKLDVKTMNFTAVQVIKFRNISGDVFACAKDLEEFLQKELGHPVAMNIDELKGMITIKGAQLSLLEKFLYACGF